MKDNQTQENNSEFINQENLFIQDINKGDLALAIENYEEAEKYYSKVFYNLLKLNNSEKQAESLKKLGDVYHLKAQGESQTYSINYNKAIALYNAALIKSNNKEYKNELISKIKEIEDSFLQSIGIIDKAKVSTYDSDIVHQKTLKEIRAKLKSNIKSHNIQNINDNQIVYKIENIQNIYSDVTKEIQGFILELIGECKTVLGDPPCNYAIIALGSLAREEMTPYSDFEWAILIEDKGKKKNKKYEKYFKNLTNLLHIKVLNLGETIIPSMEIDALKNYYDATSTRGFCFDGLMNHACKWPLGNMHSNVEENKKFKLIDTPEKIVSKYINKDSFDKNRGLFSVLSNTRLIEGNDQIYQDFINKRQVALDQDINNGLENPCKLREYAALEFLRANVISYLPKVGKLIENQQNGIKRIYPVKNDLYRLPHLVLDGLALYYNLNFASSWDRISELGKLQLNGNSVFFNERTVKYFRESFDEIASLRLNHYLNANSQRDEIELETSNENEKILKLYEFHIYLNDAAYDFALNDKKESFNTLPNEHHLTRIRVLEKLGRYDEVEKECKEAIKDHQDLGTKLNILNRLGLAQFYMGKEKEAYETLDGYRQIEGLNEHNPFDSVILHNLALALSNMGKYHYALKSINAAIDIIEDKSKIEKIKSLYKIKIFDSYQFYQEKASILLRLGNLKEARENLNKADIEVEEYYKHGKNGEYWNFKADLAQVYAEFGNIELINFKQAQELYDEAIKGLSSCLGAMHSSVASAVSRKAQLLIHEAKHQEALGHYEQALFIYHQNGKDYHSIEIAKCLSDKSICYVWQGEYELALKYINEAIKIYEEKEKKLGLNPRLKAIGLTNLAKITQEIFLKKVREEKINDPKETADEINLVFKQYKDVFKVLAQEDCGAELVDLTFILTNLVNFILEIENAFFAKSSKVKDSLPFNKIELRKLCVEYAEIGIKFINKHIKNHGKSVRAIDTYGGILNAKASILLKVRTPKEPAVNLFLEAKQKLQEFFPDNKSINLIIANTNIGKIYYNDSIHYKVTQPSKSEKYRILAAKYFLLSLQWASNSEAFIKQKPIIYFELAKLLRDFDLTSKAKYYASLALENETYLTLSLTESDRRKLIEIKRYENKNKFQLKNWFTTIEEEWKQTGSFKGLHAHEESLTKWPTELERQWNKLVDIASKQKIIHPILLGINNEIQRILEKKELSDYATFNPNENKLEGSIMEKKQQIDEALQILYEQESKHYEVLDVNMRATGTMMTGDQLATILQAIKEGAGIKDRVEFTPTITSDTLEAFINQAISRDAIRKIQFGVINVVSENKNKQILSPVQLDQMPGEHWVSYIQVPNLFDKEGNVQSVRAILLNSAGESYAKSLNEIKSKIEEMFTQHNIQITIPIWNLDYQKQDIEQYHDWNTCGIWACYFFEATIEKIAKAENAADVNFKDLTEYINIKQKRQEYSSLLKALDVSTNPITGMNIDLNTDKILDIDSTEIDKELSDKYGVNTEDIDLDKLLNSQEAKKLIEIIKDKVNPPILDEETDLAKDQRLAILTKAFVDLAELYIGKADSYDGDKIKQTKIQYYTEAAKLLNYALSIRQDIVDKTVITAIEKNRQIHYTIEPTLEEIHTKLVNVVGGDLNRAGITSIIKNAILDKAALAFEQAANLYQETEEKSEYTPAIENQAICLSMSSVPTTTIDNNKASLTNNAREVAPMLSEVNEESILSLENAEMILSAKLKENQKNKDVNKEINIISQLAEVYTKKAIANLRESKDVAILNFNKAAALYNYAISLCEQQRMDRGQNELVIYEKKISILNEHIFNLANEIVEGLIVSKKMDRTIFEIQNQNHKQHLFGLRQWCRTKLAEIDAKPYIELNKNDKIARAIEIKQIYKAISDSIKTLITTMIEECKLILGDSSDKYAIIGLGSLAKEEATPYSDFEWAIITESVEGQEINKQYLKDLANLLHFKVINIGETILPAMAIKSLNDYESSEISTEGDWFFDSTTRRGFAFDALMPHASKWPLGNRHVKDTKEEYRFDLIKSVKDLVSLAIEQKHSLEEHFYPTLNTITYIYGDEGLVEEYREELQTAIPEEKRKQLAHKFLIENCESFKPKLGKLSKEGRYFDPKKDFYRLIGLILDDLSLYYNINDNDSWQKIDKLFTDEEAIFIGENSQIAANNLKIALSRILEIRLKTYLHQDRMQDQLIPLFSENLETTQTELAKYFGIRREEFLELYYTIIPVYRVGEQFVKSSFNPAVISSESFYDDGYFVQAEISSKLLNHYKAIDYYKLAIEKLLSLGEENNVYNLIVAYINIANEYSKISDYHNEVEILNKALFLAQDLVGSNQIFRAEILNNLSVNYYQTGYFEKALTVQKQALEILKFYLVENDPQIATAEINLGNILCSLGRYTEAEQHYNSALLLVENSYSKNCETAALVFSNLGVVFGKLGNELQSINCLKRSLKIKMLLKGSYHPDVAYVLGNMGVTYQSLGQYDNALLHYKQSLEISDKFFGRSSPNAVILLGNIGFVLYLQGQSQEAIRYLDEAKIINEQFFQQHHISYSSILSTLGNIYRDMGQNNLAISCFNQALKIQIKSLRSQHQDIARNMADIGCAYSNLGNTQSALSYLNDALIMFQSIMGEEHVYSAAVMNDIGRVYNKLNKINIARKYFLEALNIFAQNYGDRHPDIATTLNNLGCAEEREENYENAISYFSQARTIYLEKNIFNEANIRAININIQKNYLKLANFLLLKNHDIVQATQIYSDLRLDLHSLKTNKYMAKLACDKGELNDAITQYNCILMMKTLSEQSGEFSQNQAMRDYLFANYPSMYGEVYQQLGSLYHAKAMRMEKEGDLENRVLFLTKAEENFLQCIVFQVNNKVNLKYANFLYQTQRYDEVIIHLAATAAILDTELRYDHIEKESLDRFLYREVEPSNNIILSTSIYAQYLLINSFYELGCHDQIDNRVAAFKLDIESKEDPLSYSLLGYVCQKLKRFDEAASSFIKAINLYHNAEEIPKANLAQKNYKICISMLSLAIVQKNDLAQIDFSLAMQAAYLIQYGWKTIYLKKYLKKQNIPKRKESASHSTSVDQPFDIRYLKKIIYDNPLLNLNLLDLVSKKSGVRAVNKFIAIWENDKEAAQAIMDAESKYGAEHVFSTLFTPSKSINEVLKIGALSDISEATISTLEPETMQRSWFDINLKEYRDNIAPYLTSIDYLIDFNWQIKKIIYIQDIEQFRNILDNYAIDRSVEVLRDYSNFRKSVLVRLHPDKGGTEEEFVFAKELQAQLQKNVNLKEIIDAKLQTIQPMIYKAGMGFRLLDMVIDTAKLIYEPTLNNVKSVALDSSYLYSMYYGVNGYSSFISTIHAFYQAYQGEYAQALQQLATTGCYMALPIMLSYTGIPYISFMYGIGITAYSGYSAVVNIYRFDQEYGSLGFELRSATSYRDITKVLANLPINFLYDFTSSVKQYEIQINNVNLAIEKAHIKQQIEEKREFGQKLYKYIFVPMIEEKYSLLNKVIKGDLTKERAEVMKAKHMKISLESMLYEHCMEIKDIEIIDNKEHYYCYNEVQQILDHIIIENIGENKDIEIIERL